MLESKASAVINSITFSPFTKLPDSDQFQTEPRASWKVAKEKRRQQKQPLWGYWSTRTEEDLTACTCSRKNSSQTITGCHVAPVEQVSRENVSGSYYDTENRVVRLLLL